MAKVGSKCCKLLNKSSNVLAKVRNFCQSGKITSNLVPLPATVASYGTVTINNDNNNNDDDGEGDGEGPTSENLFELFQSNRRKRSRYRFEFKR